MFEAMSWTVETLNQTVERKIEAFPEDMRARLARVAKLIEEKGPELVAEPHVKHVAGRLWEIRLRGRGGISRLPYVTAAPERVLIVRVFAKRTKKPGASE